MKIKNLFLILSLINLMTISCQSKSEDINLSILNEPSKNVIGSKETYPLKYRDFVDSLHTRVVLQENNIQDKWQPFVNNELKLNYMDVYFNNESVIGFKGYIEAKSKNDTENLYRNIFKYISDDKTYKTINLINNDPNLLINEWETKDKLLGIQYEKGSKQFAVLLILKSELPTFYDKIFYSEFLNLTKFRDKNSQIKLKELKVLPSKSEKDFYRQKINEIKKEYNKNQ